MGSSQRSRNAVASLYSGFEVRSRAGRYHLRNPGAAVSAAGINASIDARVANLPANLSANDTAARDIHGACNPVIRQSV